jgi:hypothetical protein
MFPLLCYATLYNIIAKMNLLSWYEKIALKDSTFRAQSVKKKPIAALLKQVRSISVPHVRLKHDLPLYFALELICECHPEAKPKDLKILRLCLRIITRCPHHDKRIVCHPERSEGSCSIRDVKTLHYVQDDKRTLFIAMTNEVFGIMQNSLLPEFGLKLGF